MKNYKLENFSTKNEKVYIILKNKKYCSFLKVITLFQIISKYLSFSFLSKSENSKILNYSKKQLMIKNYYKKYKKIEKPNSY